MKMIKNTFADNEIFCVDDHDDDANDRRLTIVIHESNYFFFNPKIHSNFGLERVAMMFIVLICNWVAFEFHQITSQRDQRTRTTDEHTQKNEIKIILNENKRG